MKPSSIVLLTVFFSIPSAMAQWVATNVPSNLTVLCLAADAGSVYAGTDGNGIYLSTDGGANWGQMSTGLTTQKVTAIGFSGTYIYVGTNGNGVYRSSDHGGSWAQTNSGLTSLNIRDLAVHGSSVFVGTTTGGVFRSVDSAQTWAQVNAGFATVSVRSLLSRGGLLFAGTQGDRVYRTSNDGVSWTNVSNGLPQTTDYCLLSGNSTLLFVGTGGSYYRSNSNGDAWITIGQIAGTSFTTALSAGENTLFAGTYNTGVFRNAVGDTGWASTNDGLTNLSIRSLLITGTYLYAGTTAGLWRRPISEVTATDVIPASLPGPFVLEQNYPNPFNPSTTIEFTIPHRNLATLKVFNLLGEEVETLVAGELTAGKHTVRLHGSGRPSGIYFLQLQAGEFVQIRKLILLR